MNTQPNILSQHCVQSDGILRKLNLDSLLFNLFRNTLLIDFNFTSVKNGCKVQTSTSKLSIPKVQQQGMLGVFLKKKKKLLRVPIE